MFYLRSNYNVVDCSSLVLFRYDMMYVCISMNDSYNKLWFCNWKRMSLTNIRERVGVAPIVERW